MVVFITLLTIAALVNGIFAQICATPNSTEGECIKIRDCHPLLNIFRARELTPQAIRYMRRSQCGFEGEKPKVCCPTISSDPRPFTLPRRPERREASPLLISRFGEPDGLLPSPDECGFQFYINRIFDGVVTAIDEFPWMTLLEYEGVNGRGFACGGALISHRYVLTAAHCVTGSAVQALGNLISVRLGEHDLLGRSDCDADYDNEACAFPPIDIPVESTHPHPEYRPGTADRYHDIALVRLRDLANYTDFVQPICLPNNYLPPTFTEPGKLLHISGWGQTETRAASTIKLKALVPVVSESDCRRLYRYDGIRIGSGQICAGGTSKDSCRGDSGGPLMVVDDRDRSNERWYSVGIISFGADPCAKEDTPAVYTKTEAYIDWIQNTIQP